MFIPIAIGVLCSAACAPLINKHYMTLCHQYGGKPPAEVRLIPMMLSCWFIPIGLFIFAWTSYPNLSWAGPALGGLPVGFGFIFLYNAANNYLGSWAQIFSLKPSPTITAANTHFSRIVVDSYQHQAASALAAKTFLRSVWGASTVLFTNQM